MIGRYIEGLFGEREEELRAEETRQEDGRGRTCTAKHTSTCTESIVAVLKAVNEKEEDSHRSGRKRKADTNQRRRR